MNNDEIFKISCELASDLAGDELQSNIADMFIENSREKAKKYREL